MAICNRHHANMSKETMTLADIDITPPLRLAYGHAICQQSNQSVFGKANHFREFKAIRQKTIYTLFVDTLIM